MPSAEFPADDDPAPDLGEDFGDDGGAVDDEPDDREPDEDADDCGVPEPIAPHAARGPERLPRNFSGLVPLFPLPGCVFFPHTLLPLHIFEPRYRAMTRDALGLHEDGSRRPRDPDESGRRGERLIAMARLRDGFDTLLEHAGDADLAETSRPPIHDTVCVGKIVAEQRLPDGRFQIVLRGVVRAAVRGERLTPGGYRLASVAPLPDVLNVRPDLDRPHRVRQLTEAFAGLQPDIDLPDVLARAFGRCVTPGMVCDVITSVLQLTPDESQELLDQVDPDVRADVVLRHLRRHLVKAGFKSGRRGLAEPQPN